MKVRQQNRVSLHRETVRVLDLRTDLLRDANGGAASSLCTKTWPHCDTVTPCIN